MSFPDDHPPDPSRLIAFEQLCHEVSNPLMIISGNAYLLSKMIRRLPHLPDHECAYLLTELTAIVNAVEVMATHLEVYREGLVDGLDNP